jgi:molybdenum cofactor cytidylyltransferase
MTVGVLILAAGQSERMQSDKRLLPWRNTTLVEHAIELCNQTGLESIVALSDLDVDDAISARLSKAKTKLLRVPNAREGMGATIANSINHLPAHWSGLLIHLCDMPLVTASTLKSMAVALQKHRIVIPSYVEKWGNPRGFDRSLWPDLAKLGGDVGAKALIKQNLDQVFVCETTNSGVLTDLDDRTTYEFWYRIDQENGQ